MHYMPILFVVISNDKGNKIVINHMFRYQRKKNTKNDVLDKCRESSIVKVTTHVN